MAAVSAADSTPAAASACAQATLPVTSSSKSARSKPKEMPKSKAAGSGAVSKRPDQSVTRDSPLLCCRDRAPHIGRRRQPTARHRLAHPGPHAPRAEPPQPAHRTGSCRPCRAVSKRPTPCRPAMSARLSTSSTGGIGTSLIATGTPSSKRISRCAASAEDAVAGCASFGRSSASRNVIVRPQRF